jgi:hypothetical protein
MRVHICTLGLPGVDCRVKKVVLDRSPTDIPLYLLLTDMIYLMLTESRMGQQRPNTVSGRISEHRCFATTILEATSAKWSHIFLLPLRYHGFESRMGQQRPKTKHSFGKNLGASLLRHYDLRSYQLLLLKPAKQSSWWKNHKDSTVHIGCSCKTQFTESTNPWGLLKVHSTVISAVTHRKSKWRERPVLITLHQVYGQTQRRYRSPVPNRLEKSLTSDYRQSRLTSVLSDITSSRCRGLLKWSVTKMMLAYYWYVDEDTKDSGMVKWTRTDHTQIRTTCPFESRFRWTPCALWKPQNRGTFSWGGLKVLKFPRLIFLSLPLPWLWWVFFMGYYNG